MGQDMKDNLKILLNMGWVQKDLSMERHLLEVMTKIDQMDKESIIGQTVITTKDNFQMD